MTAILLAYLLMMGTYLKSGSFNEWYIIILPFTFAMISSSIVVNDKRKNYHGMFSIINSKKELWYAKIITGSLYLFVTCMIFAFILSFFGDFSSALNNFTASFVLFITFAWQVPLFMFISDKVGIFFSVLISVVCNLGIAVVCAVEKVWWIPFAIPSRLMCPIIGVMPNGLPVESNSIFSNSNVIIPGLIITIALYFIVSYVTGVIFEKKEV